MSEPIISPHGGYRGLKCFQLAEIIQDGTVVFTERFVSSRSRTVDQMVQAARSAKQNIAEASEFSGTSKKMELKLLGVARASMEELLQDYEDYLRQNRLQLWTKDHPKALFIRKLTYKSEQSGTNETNGPHESQASHKSHSPNPPTKKSYETYRPYLEEKTPETAANTLICLIRQSSYLLDRLLATLAEEFKNSGGITERLYKARKEARDMERPQSTRSHPPDSSSSERH